MHIRKCHTFVLSLTKLLLILIGIIMHLYAKSVLIYKSMYHIHTCKFRYMYALERNERIHEYTYLGLLSFFNFQVKRARYFLVTYTYICIS